MYIGNYPYHPDAEISSGQRTLRSDGAKFDACFPNAEGKDKIIYEDGAVTDTLKTIESVVHTYLKDTEVIARKLKQPSLQATLEAIWTFLYHNIQYQLDQAGREELRRPARSWKDRHSGIDCDCFSIFCSSILCNLGIAHTFRVTRYSRPYWQHIYVIVPLPGTNRYYTIDAVLSRFDYEKPFTQKMDYDMSLDGIKIAVLSGPESNHTGTCILSSAQMLCADSPALHAAIFGIDLNGLAGPEPNTSKPDKETARKLYCFLAAIRQTIKEHPLTAWIAGYNHEELLRMLDYALHYWNTDKRDQAIGQLIANELYLNQISGLDGFDEDELGADDEVLLNLLEGTRPKPKKKTFFKKIGSGLKQAGKGLVRFNPVTIAARNGFLLALKLNVGKISERLKWAWATDAQLKAKGKTGNHRSKAQAALTKIEKLFTKIGGKSSNLKNAVLKSKKGRLNGLDGLGLVPVAAALAAATPLLTAVVKILRDGGLVSPDESIDLSTPDEETEGTPENYEAAASASETASETETMTEELSLEGLGGLGDALTFARNNPGLSLAIGGALAIGVYQVFKPPAPVVTRQLSGIQVKGRKKGRKPVPVFQL